MIPRALSALLALGLVALLVIAALFYGEGRGIDYQRTIDKRNICRAYPSPEPITGFHCGPVVFPDPSM